MDNLNEFTLEEQAFRRGFRQGFWVGKNKSEITQEDVLNWSYGDEEMGPPGTYLESTHMDGLRNKDSHRFFLNRDMRKKEGSK